MNFFIGMEVEKTQFYGLKTLFVVGHQNFQEIKKHIKDNDCTHVYFGANYSYNDFILPFLMPQIKWLLEDKIKVTLDIPYEKYEKICEKFKDANILNSEYFCLNVSCKFKNVNNIKNLSVKLDDESIDRTNPGVWVINKEDKYFTSWNEYKDDREI